MKTTEPDQKTSISRAAARLRCDRQTLRRALDHAEVAPDPVGKYCPTCCRLARELWRYRDTTAESAIIAAWLDRELGPDL